MPPNNLAPLFVQVAIDPRMDLAAEPFNIADWIIAHGLLAIGVCGATDVHHMDQGVGVAKIVQELVSKSLSF